MIDNLEKQKAEVIRLLQAGSSQTRAAELVGCSRRSVQRWREKAMADGVSGLAAKVGRKKYTKRPKSQVATAELAEKIGLLDIPADLVEVRSRWLPNARRLVDEAFEHGDSVRARDWMRIYIECAERLIAAIPPPPPDPAQDPANLEARDRLRAKLSDMATTTLKKLCDACRTKVSPAP